MSDALEDLEALLPLLPDAVERQRLGQQSDDATAKLQAGRQEAERLTALLDAAALLGFDSVEQRGQLDEVSEEAWKVGTSLAMAGDAEALKQAIFRFERDLLPALRTLHRDLLQHWRGVALRDFAPLVQVGEMLAKLDQGSALARELVNCGARAAAMQQTASAPEFLTRTRDLVEQRGRLQDQRRAALGEGAVADFVNALAEGHARLDMVTDEVRTWLDAHGASARLRVAV